MTAHTWPGVRVGAGVVALALFLVAVLAVPAVVLLSRAAGADPGGLWRPLAGSASVATLVAAGGTVVAAAAALTAQSLRPAARRAVDLLVLAPLILPPATTAAAVGALGGASAHGVRGMSLALAVSAAPLPYALMRLALRGTDPRVVEAARVNGAGPGRTLGLVVLPRLSLTAPAAAAYLFVTALSDPSVPAVLGGRTPTLAYAALLQVTAWGEDRVAALLGLVLLLPSLAVVAVVLRRRRVGWAELDRWIGSGTSPALPWAPVTWMAAAITAGWLAVVATIGAGLVGLLAEPRGPVGADALLGTLGHAGLGTALAAGLGLISARLADGVPRLARPLDSAQTLLALLPGTTLGIAFSLTYHGSPLLPAFVGGASVGGGSVAIVAMFAVVSLPVVHLALRAAWSQVPAEQLAAARVHGAGPARVRRAVVRPQTRAMTVAVLAAVLARTVVSVVPVIYVTSPDVPLVLSRTLDQLDHARTGEAVALSLLQGGVTALAVGVMLAAIQFRPRREARA